MKALLFLALISTSVLAGIKPLTGQDIVSQTTFLKNPNTNGLVVVFLSAQCPCSDSHVSYLKELKNQFPAYEFVGVHSNSDEDIKNSKEYFKKKNLNFPILKDNKSILANEFGASRTPHSFLVSNDGDILYRGGVTNSSKSDKATEFYLFEALKSHQEDKVIKTKESRVLGCEIERE